MISKALNYSIICSLFLLPIKSIANNYMNINGKWSTYYVVSDTLGRNEDFILKSGPNGVVKGTLILTEVGQNASPQIIHEVTGKFIDDNNIILQAFFKNEPMFTYKFKKLDENKIAYTHPWHEATLTLTRKSDSTDRSSAGNTKKSDSTDKSSAGNTKKSDSTDKSSAGNTKRSNISLGKCVEQYYPDNSKDIFVLRNTCNNMINIKYTFSESKPFSGTYTTLRPREKTFETGKGKEKIKFNYCTFPKVPQTLEKGCI